VTSRRCLAAVLTTACVLLGAAIPAIPAVAASAPPRLLRFDDTTQFAVRPATLTFGADGGTLVLGPGVTQSSFQAHHDGHIHWTAWTATGATGTATVWINQCRPNCAAGHYTSYPGTAKASRVVKGRYTRLTLSYQRGAQTVTKRFRLTRFGSIYGWQ
jgi:hypothetical protein